MPNSINGNTPAIPPKYPEPLYPHPSGEPQSITFSLDSIRQLEGLYCLNDLHKMAGGHKRQSPYYYLKSPRGKKLIAIYETEQNYAPLNGGSYICSIKGKGQKQGTYTDLAIALDYASWIDTRFFILLSQYLKNGVTSPPELTFSSIEQEVNFITRLTNRMRDNGSIAGYVLNKCKFRKVIDRQLQLALERQQLTLALEG